jgi:hypothetical protein
LLYHGRGKVDEAERIFERLKKALEPDLQPEKS